MDYEYIGKDLIKKVKILSGVKVFHHMSGQLVRSSTGRTGDVHRSAGHRADTGSKRTPGSQVQKDLTRTDYARFLVGRGKRLVPIKPVEVVAIASSTGGPSALLKILKGLPASFPVPVVIVQHICEGFGQGFVDWLNKECALTIKTADRGEPLQAGSVYVAPDGFHVLIDPGRTVRLSKSMPVNGLRPNATLMMESAAKVYGAAVLGIILTGMGRDGADGMREIKAAGGLTLAQSPESCVVFGMPKEAIELGVVDKVLPVERMADEILKVIPAEEYKA